MKEEKLNSLLMGSIVVSNVFGGLSYPVVHVLCMTATNMEKAISFSSVLGSVLGIMLGIVWTKYSGKLIKSFNKTVLLETIIKVLLIVITAITKDFRMFYIVDSVLASTLVNNRLNGWKMLKGIFYKEDEFAANTNSITLTKRAKYDINSTKYLNTGRVIGFALSYVLSSRISVNAAFVLLVISILCENIPFMMIYKWMKKHNEI